MDVSREAEKTRVESKRPRSPFSILVLAFALAGYSVLVILNLIFGFGLAVGKLASTNLGYQDYANMIEKRSISKGRKRIPRAVHGIIGNTLTNNNLMMEAAIYMVIRASGRVRESMDTARETKRIDDPFGDVSCTPIGVARHAGIQGASA